VPLRFLSALVCVQSLGARTRVVFFFVCLAVTPPTCVFYVLALATHTHMHTFVPPAYAFACMFIVYTLLNNARRRRALYVSKRAMKLRKNELHRLSAARTLKSSLPRENSRLLREREENTHPCAEIIILRGIRKSCLTKFLH
jgi:hypothetical protein